MIQAPPDKVEVTRKRCLLGARGLLQAISIKIGRYAERKKCCTISVEFNSFNGIISATETESRRVESRDGGMNPDALIDEINDQLDELALQGCHRAIKIEFVACEGSVIAFDFATVRHRWDS